MVTKKFSVTFAFYYCLLLSVDFDSALSKPFIHGLTACKRNDPELDECLMNILKQAKPQLMNGDPEQNLPSLDPVRIPKISIHRTLQDIKVSGELIDLVAKNASSMILKTSKVDLKENTWDMVLSIPLITFVTEFNLNVSLKALHLPVFGSGQCEGKISRCVIHFHSNTEVEEGKLKLNDIKIKLNIGDVDVNIIKSQNPSMAQTASQFFNANKRLVLDLLTPIAEDTTKNLLLRHVNKILSTMEITDLLID